MAIKFMVRKLFVRFITKYNIHSNDGQLVWPHKCCHALWALEVLGNDCDKVIVTKYSQNLQGILYDIEGEWILILSYGRTSYARDKNW